MFSGFVHQGAAPKAAIIVAAGQASAASVFFSQPLTPSGTILQFWSDLISMILPSARLIRKPKSIPAEEEALNAFTARTCLPGDISGGKSKSNNSRHAT